MEFLILKCKKYRSDSTLENNVKRGITAGVVAQLF